MCFPNEIWKSKCASLDFVIRDVSEGAAGKRFEKKGVKREKLGFIKLMINLQGKQLC